MKIIIIIILTLITGWYGHLLYEQNGLPSIQSLMDKFKSNEQIKCITKEGRVLYGRIPEGVICENLEPVKGSLTIIPSQDYKKESRGRAERNISKFKCDGRQYCSQMNSRAEAEFFVTHCPNTKMDGDNDGRPCENDSRL